MGKPLFVDLGDIAEDQRIAMMAHQVTAHKRTTAFIVEDAGTAERYIRKLKELDAGIQVLGQGKGPVPGAVWVKIGPAETVH